jgi:ABC-type uncharacterized transport system YnjBCD ATPase subunit
MNQGSASVILRSYLRRLTNLTSRNRSLVLLSLPQEQFLDVQDLDFLNGKPAFDLLAQLLAQKSQIPLLEVLDPRFDRVNEASKRLRKIARTAAFVEAEIGAQDLYVGWPFVQGKLNDGTLIRGPLLFFPVSLKIDAKLPKSSKTSEVANPQWVLVRRDEPVTLNRSLLLAYAHFNAVPVSDDWLDASFEDFPKDPLEFRTRLYELLKTSPLRLNFNSEVFDNVLQPFERLTRADLDERTGTGELKCYPQAVLGLFPQAGSYLVPDYEELLVRSEELFRSEEQGASGPPRGSEHENSSLLPFFSSDSSILTPVSSLLTPEKDTLTPLPVDASQEEAIRRVKAGESLVVQGPPGTGKSQLIANLIADFTARGKRVLLVCQKRAALDTVFDRLTRLGMGQFVANVHDFRADRKALYAQLAAQIEATVEYQRVNASLDAILLDRRFSQEARTIEQTQRDLQAFREALFDASICGLSPKELYLTSDPNGPVVPLDDVYAAFRFDEAGADFFRRLDRYEAYLQRIGPQHPWADRVDFSRFTFAEVPAIRAAVEDVPAFTRQLAGQTGRLLHESLSFAQAEAVLREVPLLNRLGTALENEAQWRLLRQKLVLSSERLDEWERRAEALFAAPGPETTVPTEEIDAISQQLHAAREAKTSAFSGWVWTWFSKEKTGLQALAQRNGLGLKPADLDQLSEKLLKRRSLETLLSELREAGLIPDSPDERTLKTLLHDARQAQQANQLLDAVQSLDLRGYFNFALLGDFKHLLYRLAEVVGTIPDQLRYWQQYLTDAQRRQLQAPDAQPEDWTRTLQRDFDLLREADVLKTGFSRTEWTALERAQAHALTHALTQVLTNSLKLAWLNDLETRQPLLRSVSGLAMETLETDLQCSMQAKQELGREILLMRLREQTYRDLERNRLGNVTTYRELGHQVTKRRNTWPLRRLLSEFPDEIFDLVPCWMASPESVSALFPLTEGLFDLVIFDEASQCFAEQGLPALVRGQQVLVAGDSQQLQPSDLYRIRFEADAEEVPDLEVVSLLDLASRYLPQTQLNGHYRSRSLDLIDFSNQHFYGRTLQLLPDFAELNRREPAIRYLRVIGRWENQTNEVEAQQVVDLVRELARSEPELSVGVVTFNFRQQALIQEWLEGNGSGTPNLARPLTPGPSPKGEGGIFSETTPFSLGRGAGGEGLFIKNIENVQGDERDVIIFSIGYAPDANGYLAMQFGSLNAAGGENRLNVAVTRARQRIYVVASIWPEQLRVEETLNDGPKLLKAYLVYAREVSEGQYRPQPVPVPGVRTEWLLKEKLKAQDASLRAELPFADLTVKSGERYEGLLLTDDELYFQSRSPKEAHAYLPIGLRAKGWPFRRVWSREFWRSR